MQLTQIINTTIKTDWKDFLLEIDTEALDKYLTEKKELFKDDIAIYPPDHLIFNCFSKFNINQLKIVLLGQDPYINKGEAMGMCFSVPDGIKIPPSLKNIYKEIEADIGKDMSARNGDLSHWSEQGILLLNSALTVVDGRSNSHQKEWSGYTEQIIKMISDKTDNIIFILWGKNAQSKKKLIDIKKHHILESVHPSPLSANRGFFGCKHFSKCNNILETIGKKPIDW